MWLSEVSSREGGKSGGRRGSEGLAAAGPPRPCSDSVCTHVREGKMGGF